MRKLKNYEIFKIKTSRLTEHHGKKVTVIPLELSKREALEKGEIVKIQQNQLTNRILNHFSEHGIERISGFDFFLGLIVNVVVPPESKQAGVKEYEAIAREGFWLNNEHYVRLFSGSGQIRRNTITFIREDLYEPIINSLLCGLTLDDFGDHFNAAKFNAYCGLNMSGAHLLPENLSPRVCVVDDFEEIRPHNTVNHVSEREVEYVTLKNEDHILEHGQKAFLVQNGKAIRKSDGMEFTVRKGNHKQIEEVPYDEIEGSPCLNSFDGQGLMSPNWAEKVAKYLCIDYIPAELIVRAPWVKGLLATVPFHEYFLNRGITEITDSFGKRRKVEDIDIILSKSQFKMHKVYAAKCSVLGLNAWDYHNQSMQDNHLLWGVARVSKKEDDSEKALNYQYLQALQMDNENVDALCSATEDFLRRLNQGTIEDIYQNLIVNGQKYAEESSADEDQDNEDYKKLFQKVLEVNPDFVKDCYIRYLILKECASKMNGAKLGKLLVRGNFQFCVSDPVAQLQWVERNHCGKDCPVTGVVPAGHIYSNYWLSAEDRTQEVVLMRSPLIDRNEIAKRKIVDNREEMFRYLTSGLVYSIHDLTALQQAGCDFDGDIVFSTNNQLIANACYDYSEAKPLYYALNSTDLVGRITKYNITQADIRGLNSKVGQISNRGASLYAMLQNYSPESKEYKMLFNSIIVLGQIVGMEIDRIKTAVAPTYPLEWTALQVSGKQTAQKTYERTVSEEERDGIYRHNALVPDTKPYYFRYNYDYLNKDLITLYKSFNTASDTMMRKKFTDVISDCNSGNGTAMEKELYEQYRAAYPVLDSDCLVNHVSHYFEALENAIGKEVHADGENMLVHFVTTCDTDDSILGRVRKLVFDYKRYRHMATKKLNSKSGDNNRQLKKSASETLRLVRNFYREELLSLTGEDLQRAFDYLVRATANDENVVWEILGDSILKIIKKGIVVN